MTHWDPRREWQHSNRDGHHKLVHTLENYEFDLDSIQNMADVRGAISILKLQPWATRRVVVSAKNALTGFVRWLRAEEKFKRLQKKRAEAKLAAQQHPVDSQVEQKSTDA